MWGRCGGDCTLMVMVASLWGDVGEMWGDVGRCGGGLDGHGCELVVEVECDAREAQVPPTRE